MLKISMSKFISSLLICLTGMGISTFAAQAQSPLTNCKSIVKRPSPSHHLQGVRWLDANTVAFKFDFSPTDFTGLRQPVLYQYDLQKGQLSIQETLPLLDVDPQIFQSLDKTDWALTTTTFVQSSPDRSKIVFPRYAPNEALPAHLGKLWLRDIATGIEHDLGLTVFVDHISNPPILWSPYDDSLIVYLGLNTRIIRFDGESFTEEQLVDWLQMPIDNVDMFQPMLIGVSPAWRFFIFRIIALPDLTYIYDAQKKIWSRHEIELNYIPFWLSESTFIAQEASFHLAEYQGRHLFEYNILSFQKNDLLFMEKFSGQFSPDGRHVVFEADSQFFVCNMPEGFPPSPVVVN
jgi:hypothetical protein